MATRKDIGFDEALEQLEKSIERLEDNDLTLEEALAYFEKGIALIRQCEGTLRKAEGKLRELIEGENGETIERIIGADLSSLLGGEPLDE